jgi:hypothetical protein
MVNVRRGMEETTELTCSPILYQQGEVNFTEIRTDCKPGANNSYFRGKRGVFPGKVLTARD